MNPRTAHTVAQIRARRAMNLTKPRRRLPRDPGFAMIAQEYARAILAIVAHIRPAFADLEAELPSLIESARRERGDTKTVVDSSSLVRTDAGQSKRVRGLVAAAKAKLTETISTEQIDALAEKFAQRTSTAQRIAMNKQVRAALGADLFTNDRNVPPMLESFVESNVALIKGISDEVAARVEKTVLDAVQTGTLSGDLAKKLDEDFGFGADRAKLIATDQIGKAYSSIAQARHRELGITRFRWRTARDSRVRGTPKSAGGKYPRAKPSHYLRDGVIYSYDDPPKGRDGRPELPGQPIRCRCTAEPVFDDLLADLDGTEPPPSTSGTVDAEPVAPDEAARYVDKVARAPLTAADQQAVYRYQGLHVQFQAFAREGDWLGSYETKKDALREQRALDAAIKKGALPRATRLYRGVGLRGLPESLEVGASWVDAGYSSTSLLPSTAEEFRHGGVLLEIDAPAGTPAAFVPAAGGLDEAELLLARGARFTVKSSRVENGVRILRVALS